MLRSICVTAKSGIVLFASDFEGGGLNVRLVAGLLTAMSEISVRAVGSPVNYIQMDHIAITVIHSEETGLKIVLFHDAELHRDLTRCISESLLKKFHELFDRSTFTSSNTEQFRRFSASLGPAIRGSSFSIISSMITRLRGAVQFAAIFSDGDTIFTYPNNTDALPVAANLQTLQLTLQEMAAAASDEASELCVETDSSTFHMVLFGGTTVVMQIRSTHYSEVAQKDVRETLKLLSLCFRIAESLMP